MHLAQVNIAQMKDSIDSVLMSDFVSSLDEVNALAEKSEGFIWRFKGDDNNATALRVFEDNFLIINMSVWINIQSLHNFVYSGRHLEVYRRKKEWFHQMKNMHMAMWYVPDGHEPKPEEAKEKLSYINEHGETPISFTFKSRYSLNDLNEYLKYGHL